MMCLREKMAALMIVGLACLTSAEATAQSGPVDFGSDRWLMADAVVTEQAGRKSLAGTAFLKDVSFSDGVIEVDVLCSGARSYPGIVFRMERPGQSERIYIRPHRSGPAGYPDVVQYVPMFNGVDAWQLYNGDGITSLAAIPAGEWLHLKIEVKGRQARIFIGNASRPALEIHDLKHGTSAGSIGLNGPRDGSAYFSNFNYRSDDTLVFDSPPPFDAVPGVLTEWQLSRPFKAGQIDPSVHPASQALGDLGWKSVAADRSGLVDIGRSYGRQGTGPDRIVAKTIIKSDKDDVRKFRFGYSDEVTLFLNGKPLFNGDSTYRLRDPSFLGIVGLFDAVYLPLKRGDNELLLVITENMGGWGFIVQDAGAVFQTPGIREVWRTPAVLAMPETVVYDSARKVFYVSSYDGFNPSLTDGKQAIARISLEGKTVEPAWVSGLKNNAGLALSGDKLYVVEMTSVAEIDVPSARVVKRTPVEGAMFLNDIAVAADGTIYLSDSRRGVIFHLADGRAEEWLAGVEISRPNGLHLRGGTLLIGNNGDNRIKAADLASKAIRTVATLPPGTIDGIEAGPDGSILVSHNEGRLYRVTASGEVTKVLDTSVPGQYLANFAYLPEQGLAVFPTWLDNRVIAYSIR